MTRDELRSALRHPNVKAFLRVIREGESNQSDSAYQMLYGGGFFSSFDEHPRQALMSPWGWTSAAGAYQIMAKIPGKVTIDTWDGICEKHGFTDFSPATQDEAAVALINRRGALQDLLRGDLSEVLEKCSFEWASLPPGRYGQPVLDAKRVYATYDKWLREFTNAPATAPAAPPTAPETPVAVPVAPKEENMPAPFLLAAANILIPLVADLFRGHGGATATRNAELVEKVGPAVVEIAKTVTGQPTEQQAATQIAADPTLLARFREAVAADMDRLVGMIARTVQIDDDSHDRAAVRAGKEAQDFALLLIHRQFWMLAALAGATVVAIIAALALKVSSDVTVGLVVLFTGLVNQTAQKWNTIVEYRFGSSSGSQAKDVIIAAASRK